VSGSKSTEFNRMRAAGRPADCTPKQTATHLVPHLISAPLSCATATGQRRRSVHASHPLIPNNSTPAQLIQRCSLLTLLHRLQEVPMEQMRCTAVGTCKDCKSQHAICREQNAPYCTPTAPARDRRSRRDRRMLLERPAPGRQRTAP
jgi:hypothetical protein